MEISKRDWKLYRERISEWQENYMEGLVKEYANFLNDDKKPGIGIANCRKRLELLYPGRYELAAGENDGIYRVRLDIRIRE